MEAKDIKKLSVAVLERAINDLDMLVNKIIAVRNACAKGRLKQHIINSRGVNPNLKSSPKYSSRLLPYSYQYEKGLIYFFEHDFFAYAEGCGMDYDVLPGPLQAKVDIAKRYCKHCLSCVQRLEKEVTACEPPKVKRYDAKQK